MNGKGPTVNFRWLGLEQQNHGGLRMGIIEVSQEDCLKKTKLNNESVLNLISISPKKKLNVNKIL